MRSSKTSAWRSAASVDDSRAWLALRGSAGRASRRALARPSPGNRRPSAADPGGGRQAAHSSRARRRTRRHRSFVMQRAVETRARTSIRSRPRPIARASRSISSSAMRCARNGLRRAGVDGLASELLGVRFGGEAESRAVTKQAQQPGRVVDEAAGRASRAARAPADQHCAPSYSISSPKPLRPERDGHRVDGEVAAHEIIGQRRPAATSGSAPGSE